MDKITLRNVNEVNLKDIELQEVTSLDDAIKKNAIKKSLQDNGITDFKEITDMNQISFGHFIVLEKILNAEIEFEIKVKTIAPFLLRPLGEEKLNNSDIEKENTHKEKVYDEPIGNIYGAFNRFLELRKVYLFKTYNGVVYGTLNEDEDDDEEEGTDVGSTQSAREFHSKKFFWNSMISLIANGDIFRFNEAVDLMMHVVMPFLAEKRSLEIIENLEAKQRRL